ncbi:MAG: Dolichyl-phosphate-mannose-mannosyltransferase family protein [Herminiimonas sp.]|nr:Dolichyl-phosphate-mannose-mannosyltransferase family protein [Herminiimonas sp.]
MSGTLFLLLLAVYFLLQILSRTSLSGALSMDEAEAVFSFQQLQLGYGTQPPVYAWLQWLMFSAFGVNLFALSALKNLILFASYASMFFLARPMLGTSGAMAVSASLLFFPEIGWESNRDRTHSVLLITMVSVTLWSYFAVLRRPTAARYALFGLLVGLGLQSKYNFAAFLAGLAVASLLVKEHRQAIWNRKVWLAAAIALLCVLPHGLWMLDHMHAATGETLQKMKEGHQQTTYLQNVASGFGTMLKSILAIVILPLLIYGIICRRYLKAAYKEASVGWRNPDARFLVYLCSTIFLILAALVLSGQASNIKARWIMPLLIFPPLAFFLLLPALARDEVYRRILQVAAACALIILLGFQLRDHVQPALGRYSAEHIPYSQLSDELARRFPDVRHLIASDIQTAGNLYFQRPALRPLLAHQVLMKPGLLEGDVLLVIPGGTPAGSLEKFRAVYPNSTVRQQGRLELPYKRSSAVTMPFDYIYIEVRKP